jgi:4-amino-4-deoxy-L-arabinose transferase-like glycosyltransferase
MGGFGGTKRINKSGFKRIFVGNTPFLVLLIGIALVTISIGPYQNWDAGLEFNASSNVIKMGVPFADDYHGIINQPPLGFYLEAAVFQIFGLSLFVGETLVTLFGLGAVVVVYLLGKELYGKSTGLVAAALFGLTPWQLILSRTFLIDAQCLFFSLFCLYVGVLAIRKNSFNLILLSGVLFAAAFMTKLYAIFMLVPLLLFYFYTKKPKGIKPTLTQTVTFILPAVFSSLIWYQFVLGGFSSISSHADFSTKNPAGLVPSYLFVFNFLNNYAIGFFFIIATVFSLVIYFGLRKHFREIFIYDMVCLATIVIVLGVDIFLGVGLNLNIPYGNAIKYDYQALPFFCLIVASLTIKSPALFRSAKTNLGGVKLLFYGLAVAGAFLLGVSLLSNMFYVNGITTINYLIFMVEPNVNLGFHIYNYNPISADSPLMIVQYVGFVVALSGLVLAVRHRIVGLAQSIGKALQN